MKDIRINALANTLVRLLNIFFPLITTAYLSRILSKQLYGEFNIANTYLNWFIPFATLGVYNYGIREISKVKNNIHKINTMFSTLFYTSVFCTIVTMIFYVAIMPVYTRKPSIHLLMLILGIQLMAQIFYIEWINEAFENYTFLFYKTLSIRIIMLVSIFTFVKEADDIIQYAFIMSFSQLLNYLLSYLWIKKEVHFVKVPLENFKHLVKPLIGLFLLSNAGMLYTNLDLTFVSKIGAPEQVSYYANGQRMIMLISGVISGAISVSVPRLSYYIGMEDDRSYQRLINKSSSMFSFLMAPIGMGLVVLGVQATVLMYGTRYMPGGIVTQVFAFRAISWALEIIMGTQVILIKGFENKLSILYIIGGLCNLVFDSALYLFGVTQPQYYAITTLLAEYILLFIEYRFIRKNELADLSKVFAPFVKYACIVIGFVPLAFFVNMFIPTNMVINMKFILNIIVTIIVCCVYYGIVLFGIKDEIFMEILEKIRGRLHG
ncbi:polysaccharide biosynthesis protein [Lachnospiraceae bacterium CAG:364]|nr:polysaccharide biosynthesis protein [Lachnospiraceae bacterium CAG:364]